LTASYNRSSVVYGDDATNGFRSDDSVAETKLADVETFVYGHDD